MFINSSFSLLLMLCWSHMESIMFIRSSVGTLEYIFVMSKDTNCKLGWKGILRRISISWTEFFNLKSYGRGRYVWSFLASILANLYAGAFSQFTTGLIGESVFCIFIKPLMVVAEGFKLTYFHFSSLSEIIWHSLIRFRSFLWKFLVGSLLTVVKLLFAMKSWIFLW